MMPFLPPRKKSTPSGENLSDDAKKNLSFEIERSNIWDDGKKGSEAMPLENSKSVIVPLRRVSLASTYSIDSSGDSHKTFVVQENETERKETDIIDGADTKPSPVRKSNETTCEVDIHDFSQFESKSVSSTKSIGVFVLNEISGSVKDKSFSPTKSAEVFVVNEVHGSVKKGSDSTLSETSNKPPVPLPRKRVLTLSSNSSRPTLKDKSGVELDSQIIKVNNSVSNESVVKHSTGNSLNDEFGLLNETKPKSRKLKQKQFPVEKEDEIIELSTFKTNEGADDPLINEKHQLKSKKPVFEQNKENTAERSVLGVVIHGCDGLVTDLLVCHPLVRVYIVDQNTGEFFKKSAPERTSKHDLAEYILPSMTQPFDFYKNKSVIPKWEEMLVFNGTPDHLLKPTTLFLFEIIDLLSFSMADCQYAQFGTESAWHHVAWAFLKIINECSNSNLNKKLRLQLYKPKRKNLSPSKSKLPHIFWWYKSRSHKPYPSTLYVTVKTVSVADERISTIKSDLPASQGTGSAESLHSFKFMHSESDDIEGYFSVNFSDKVLPKVKWNRLTGQSCKLPNSKLLSLNVGRHGAFSVQFSWSGLLLASAASSHIHIHTVPEGYLFCQLPGHQGLVYSLRWSTDDSLLLSASADCTVCIWHVLEVKKPKLLQLLPHPSYIYCAIFINKYIIASGCCDGVVRLWLCTKKINVYELNQELSVHSGFVNSLCYSDGTLYSADSEGVILAWISQDDRWIFSREYCISEIVGVNINNILMHPAGKRMIIHSRDSQLRMMDLATGAIIQWFQGCLNERLQTGSCLSQCGGILFAWSEEGILLAWNADTGEQIGIYSGDSYPAGCGCIHYHPYDHIAAFSVHSVTSNSSLVVAQFQREDPITGVGLTLMKENSYQDVKPLTRHLEWEKMCHQYQQQQQSIIKQNAVSSSKKISNQNIDVKTAEAPKKNRTKKSLLAKSVSILSGSESNLLNEDVSSKAERKKKFKKWKSKSIKNISDSIHSLSNKNLSVYDNPSFEMSDDCLNKNVKQISSELSGDLINDPRLVDIINRIDKVLSCNQ